MPLKDFIQRKTAFTLRCAHCGNFDSLTYQDPITYVRAIRDFKAVGWAESALGPACPHCATKVRTRP